MNDDATDDPSALSEDAPPPPRWHANRTRQIISVIGATALSLGYGGLTQQFVDGLGNIDWTPFWVMVGATLVVAALGIGLGQIVEALGDFINFDWRPSEAAQYRVSVLALFVAAMLCTFLLGYFTQYTGGSFYSPYVQPLLAMALLSPVVADSKETVVMMVAVVAIVFGIFGDWGGTGPEEDVNIPIWIYFLTPLVAMLIALINPLFGRAREYPLEWRWFQRRRRA